MTIATVPRLLRQDEFHLPPIPSETEFLQLMAARRDIGAMCYYGEQEQVARELVRKGYARRFDTLGVGVPRYVITPAGVERLVALTRPTDGDLRNALALLVRTAREKPPATGRKPAPFRVCARRANVAPGSPTKWCQASKRISLIPTCSTGCSWPVTWRR